MNLMDFDCDQHDSVHFFYTLPYSKNKSTSRNNMVIQQWLIIHLEKDYDESVAKLYC